MVSKDQLGQKIDGKPREALGCAAVAGLTMTLFSSLLPRHWFAQFAANGDKQAVKLHVMLPAILLSSIGLVVMANERAYCCQTCVLGLLDIDVLNLLP